jgi:hypothetical protein
VYTDRRTRYDDKLFLALILIPAMFAGARYLESKSRMDQIALQNKPPVAAVAKVPAPAPGMIAAASPVHRF